MESKPTMPEPGTAPANTRQLELVLPDAARAKAPRPRRSIAQAADLATTRYFTRAEAARYLRCSVRFLDGLGLPFIRKGRCKVYDRIDLDAHMQQDKRGGRAWKETLWPVNEDSIAARTRGTGGSRSFYRTDVAYAEALGVSIAPRPSDTSSD
jgi:hypothetical protein